MQLVVLILVAVVLLDDRLPTDAEIGLSSGGWTALLVATLPTLPLLLLQWRMVALAERAMDRRSPTGQRWFLWAERSMAAIPWVALLSTAAATLLFRWLAAVRSVVGDWPAIDELLAMLPALAAMAMSWRIHEPLERRVRESALVRNLDEGVPVAPFPSPFHYVVSKIRTNILLLLAPLLTVVAISETVEPFVESTWSEFWAGGGRELTTLLIAGFVYLISPFIARVVLRLESLPPGELRDDLRAVCDGCGVRVRDILLWRTEYGMVNGAVMGLVAPVRYVLLTDGLVELLPRVQLRAVMAHEIGHVRRHHLPWMLMMLVSLLAIASIAVEWPALRADEWIRTSSWTYERKLEAMLWLERAAALGAATLALVLFGWVSRRIERQADTFAVQYLSDTVSSSAVTPDAVMAMSGALGTVARYAGVPRGRMSWRHGSIRWRQEYLEGIVGQPTRRLRIDRLVARLKWATAAAIIGLLVLFVVESARQPEEPLGASRYDGPSAPVGRSLVAEPSRTTKEAAHAVRQDARDRQ